MLPETRAAGVHYDPGADVAQVRVREPARGAESRGAQATLLLDSEGFLVGVDVEPDLPSRTIVMLGPHEKVASTKGARVTIATDAHGAVCDVRVSGARGAIRGDEKNPYV